MMRRLKRQCFCSYTAKLRARRVNTTFFFFFKLDCKLIFNVVLVSTESLYYIPETNTTCIYILLQILVPYGLLLNTEYWLSLSSMNRKACEPSAPNYCRCSLLPSPVSCMCYVWPSPSTLEVWGDHHNTGWQPTGHLWWKGLPDPGSKGAWGFWTESTMSRGSWVERGRELR